MHIIYNESLIHSDVLIFQASLDFLLTKKSTHQLWVQFCQNVSPSPGATWMLQLYLSVPWSDPHHGWSTYPHPLRNKGLLRTYENPLVSLNVDIPRLTAISGGVRDRGGGEVGWPAMTTSSTIRDEKVDRKASRFCPTENDLRYARNMQGKLNTQESHQTVRRMFFFGGSYFRPKDCIVEKSRQQQQQQQFVILKLLVVYWLHKGPMRYMGVG